MSVKIEPFKIGILHSEVERMKRKLRDTRIPQDPIVPDAGDDYGTHLMSNFRPNATRTLRST